MDPTKVINYNSLTSWDQYEEKSRRKTILRNSNTTTTSSTNSNSSTSNNTTTTTTTATTTSTTTTITNNENGANKSIPPFLMDEKINKKLVIWYGDLWRLNVDCIVYSNNPTLSDRTGVSDVIFKYGGSEMLSDVRKNGFECRYGEAIITSAGRLPCKYVVHTVCPSYNAKYLSAAENALNSCYRSAFHLGMENHSKSIAFACLHTETRSYPTSNGTHIALRTLRRLLEKPFSADMQKVVLVIDNITNMEIYQKLLPLYFPRTRAEELNSLNSLPVDIGDENGEATEEDRRIRIIETPSILFRNPDLDEEEEDQNNHLSNMLTKNYLSKSIEEAESIEDIDRIINPFSNESLSGNGHNGTGGRVTHKNSFIFKKEDPDIAKRKNLKSVAAANDSGERMKAQLTNYIMRSKVEDLSHIAKLNFAHQSLDEQGKSLLVIIGFHLNYNDKQLLDHALVYIIKTIELIIQKGNPFSILYFHSNMSSRSSPDFSWLKHLLEIFNLKYTSYLNDFHIIHPTWLLKATLAVSKAFFGEKIFSKMIYHDNLNQLKKTMTNCNIPKSIFSYEFENNHITDFSFETLNESM
ncbi:hypothetical protein CYY_005567 [Polysphondylium violaceum]|uniref:Ganglioside induced differentiation associated protein 2 n=1 Tax=Polysphondylium violaceum TaxID=133409 RepID=A0A8J4US36_9MYCE|nr:hypothetical protein CYY_005567 [Polysphondylium violaceum]